jgi:hypothetical protein
MITCPSCKSRCVRSFADDQIVQHCCLECERTWETVNAPSPAELEAAADREVGRLRAAGMKAVAELRRWHEHRNGWQPCDVADELEAALGEKVER